MTTYSVTIERSISSNTDPAVQPESVSLKMTVTGVAGFADFGIFVYAQDPVTRVERYSHVAGPADLQDYNYEVIGEQDYVRKAALEKAYETADLASAAILEIQSAIEDLCLNMQAMSVYGPTTIVTITSN